MKKDIVIRKSITIKDLLWLMPSLLVIIFLYFPPQIINLLSFFMHINSHIPENYPYSSPPIFFSIGEAIAALAILLAVYQFKKEKWEIALEVRNYIKPIVATLLFVGFISVIVSSLTSFARPASIFVLSVFWQIISGLLISFAILFLFFKATNKKLFSNSTKKEFVSALLRRVMSRSPQQIDLVVDVLGSNLKTIIEVLKTIRNDDAKISEYKKSAHFIITQIMSNPNFANHVVTTRADFLEFFIKNIHDYNLYRDRNIEVAFSALIRALFSNKYSFFYSEMKHSDLGVYYRPFLDDIFSNQKIFLNIRPFEQIKFDFGECIDIEKLSLFTEALKIALEGYFEKSQPEAFRDYAHFTDAFDKVDDAFSRIVEEAQNNESKNGWSITNKMHQITFLFGWKFKYIYTEALKNNTVSKNDLDALMDEKSYGIYPASLTAGYAELIFKLLCTLSKFPEKDMIRHYAISITEEMIFFDDPAFSNIRKVMLKYIWEKIEGGHSSNINGFYPVVLPVFLTLVGMRPDGRSVEEKKLYNQTVEFLENKLKPKIIAGEKMANDELMENVLLPNEVIFNREKNLFEWKMRKGTQEMITIA